MDAEITDLLDEMENRRVQRPPERVRKENRPNLIAVRSSDANATEDAYWNPPRDGTTDEYNPSNNQNAFYNFSVRLPRPALSVKGLQLMSATIPQANARFPDTALVFYYYRLSKYSGLLPSINNLYMVRLLPSFYKPEMIPNASRYGFNKTFPNYPALASELVKSCRSDVLYDNVMWISTSPAWGWDNGYTYKKVPFIPKDISITFNSALNKFQMTGLNTKLAYLDWVGDGAISSIGDVFVYGITWAGDPEANGETYGYNTWKCLRNNRNITPSTGTYLFDIWNDSTAYLQYEVVSYEGAVYQAFVDTEPGDPPTNTAKWVIIPNASASTFWEQIYVEVAQAWDTNTFFKAGQFTRFGSPYVVYKALQDGVGKQPNLFEDYWEVYEYVNLPWYEYVPTGPEDENVRALAGKVALEWSPTSLYSEVRQQNIMSACVHKGIQFETFYTSMNNEPLAGMSWSSGTIYAPGDIMNYDDKGTLYRSLNPYSAVADWSDATLYSIGQRVLRDNVYYEATESNKDVDPSITMLSTWDYYTLYDVGNWVLYRTGYKEANVSEVVGVGGQVSYTTSGAMPFVIGDVVSVSGLSNPIFNLTGTITFVNAETGNFQFPSDVVGSLTGQTGLAVVDPLKSPAIGYRCVQPTQGGIIPVWNYETYNAGDYVSAWDFISFDPFGDPDPAAFRNYKCIAPTTGINPTAYPTWSGGGSYVVGSRIKYQLNVFEGPYNFIAYESKAVGSGSALGAPPNANWTTLETALPPIQATSQWELGEPTELTPDIDPTHWQSYGEYLSGNTIWRRSETNIGHQPGTPGWETWWESVDRSALDTPNWSDAEQYYPGDYVVNEDFDKSLYKCIKANVGITPGSLSLDTWELVYVRYAWRQNESEYKAESGLYYLSRYYDMYELNDNVFPFGLIFQFPYGVAGQPNVRKSKRLLSTLLGFTWNGLFNKEQFGVVLPTGDLTDLPADNATIVIYNRMRPIPRYLKNVGTGLLGDEPDGTPTSLNMTYTAESFCNLVYSSVVAIYTDIIGPSTIDTTRDTNLLAIADMNTASLGVGFYYPTLECVVENELDGIYGMYIELRDELDEPYFLSNNAVAVLTFKVHY
jgi:hypothetical protein